MLNSRFRFFILIVFLLFFIVLLLIFSNKNTSVLYGNNRDLIKTAIVTRSPIIDREDIEIIDIVDIDESRIVGFSSNGYLGVLLFEKDKNLNYVMNYYELDSHSESSFVINYDNNSKIAIVVLSNGNKATNVEVTIMNHKYNKDIPLYKPSMFIFKDDLLKKKNHLSITINFFDSLGNQLI
ncbi:TPA: hypothetical protein ACG3HB_003481 [Clostridioides difficile]